MSHRGNPGAHHHGETEQRRIREAALGKTIEGLFAATEPPSTERNLDAHDNAKPVVPHDGDTAPER